MNVSKIICHFHKKKRLLKRNFEKSNLKFKKENDDL